MRITMAIAFYVSHVYGQMIRGIDKTRQRKHFINNQRLCSIEQKPESSTDNVQITRNLKHKYMVMGYQKLQVGLCRSLFSVFIKIRI